MSSLEEGRVYHLSWDVSSLSLRQGRVTWDVHYVKMPGLSSSEGHLFFRWLNQLLQLVWILLSFTVVLCEMHRELHCETLWTVHVDPVVGSFSIQFYWVKSTTMLLEQTGWQNNGLRQPSSTTLNMKHDVLSVTVSRLHLVLPTL